MRIRDIEATDAAVYRELNQTLDAETSFRLYEPGERSEALTEYAAEIERFLQNPQSNIIVAEDEATGKLVGYLQAIGRTQRRIRHVVSVNVAILQAYTGQGLGGQLFASLETWAKAHSVHRIDLTVMQNNLPAQKLYEKLGFAREGLKRSSMYVDGEYIDEIYMSKWLD